MLHRAGADGPLRPRPALWRPRGTAGLRKHPASTCCSSGILQARSPRPAVRRDRGATLGPRGFPGPRSFTAAEAVRDERSGGPAAHETPRGSRRRRSLRGVPRTAGPHPPSPAPAAADSQWGAGHSPAPRPEASGGESGRRGLRGFRRERGALRGHASGKGPAGRRAGAGPVKSTWAAAGFRLRLRVGTEGRRGAGGGRCGVPAAHSFRTPHPVAGAPPRPQRTGIRAPGRKASQPPGAQVRAEVAASRPGGTWPSEGRPARDGACALARARPSAGKEHAQCEGTIGYVGAWGMLGESPDPAHAQKRSEPATRWWREKRGEKSPQSYVRKGRVLRGGCGLPRGPAVLLGRGA